MEYSTIQTVASAMGFRAVKRAAFNAADVEFAAKYCPKSVVALKSGDGFTIIHAPSYQLAYDNLREHGIRMERNRADAGVQPWAVDAGPIETAARAGGSANVPSPIRYYIAPVDQDGCMGLWRAIPGRVVGERGEVLPDGTVVDRTADTADELAERFPMADRNGY